MTDLARLIVRDRFILQRHRTTPGTCGYCGNESPCPEVAAVAAFWLPEEVTNG